MKTLNKEEKKISSKLNIEKENKTEEKRVKAVSDNVLDFLYSLGKATPVKESNRMIFD